MSFRRDGKIDSIDRDGFHIRYGFDGKRQVETKVDGAIIVATGKDSGYVVRDLATPGPRYIQLTYVSNDRAETEIYRGDLSSIPVFDLNASDLERRQAQTAASAVPDALDPARRTFVVDSDVMAFANGKSCKLTSGDVVMRLTDTADKDKTVSVDVAASKHGDCVVGSTMRLHVEDLREMEMHFEEQLRQTSRDSAPAAASDAIPPALDPAHRTFVVDSDVEALANGKSCKLTNGDVVTRLTDTPDAEQKVNVSVAASRSGDCAAGQTVALGVDDLQEMFNHFQEQLDNGMAELARKQREVSGTKTATIPPHSQKTKAAQVLTEQQAAADKIESEVKKELFGDKSAERRR